MCCFVVLSYALRLNFILLSSSKNVRCIVQPISAALKRANICTLRHTRACVRRTGLFRIEHASIIILITAEWSSDHVFINVLVLLSYFTNKFSKC